MYLELLSNATICYINVNVSSSCVGTNAYKPETTVLLELCVLVFHHNCLFVFACACACFCLLVAIITHACVLCFFFKWNREDLWHKALKQRRSQQKACLSWHKALKEWLAFSVWQQKAKTSLNTRDWLSLFSLCVCLYSHWLSLYITLMTGCVCCKWSTFLSVCVLSANTSSLKFKTITISFILKTISLILNYLFSHPQIHFLKVNLYGFFFQ